MSIGAGDMDQPITIERKTSAADGAGGVIETWATTYTVWAAVRAKSAGEAMEAGRVNAAYVVAFTIYTIPDLDERDRVVWNGERYNIRGVLRSGNPLTVQIDAERGVAS